MTCRSGAFGRTQKKKTPFGVGPVDLLLANPPNIQREEKENLFTQGW
jgi:hypothetical protein